MERNRKRKARRWVVERTLGRLHRCRRLLIRWEKKAENHLAFLSLACIWIVHRAVARSGGLSGVL
jgi:putative transposase